MGADVKPVVPIENTLAMCWRTFGEPFKTDYGVPQGSVHSYSLYIQRPYVVWLVDLTSATICTLMTQIYISLSKTDPEMSQWLVQQCLQYASDWMIASKLKSDPSKTDLY